MEEISKIPYSPPILNWQTQPITKPLAATRVVNVPSNQQGDDEVDNILRELTQIKNTIILLSNVKKGNGLFIKSHPQHKTATHPILGGSSKQQMLHKHKETLLGSQNGKQKQKTKKVATIEGIEKKYFYGGTKNINMVALSGLLFKFMSESFKLKAENKHYGRDDAAVPPRKLELYSQEKRSERTGSSNMIYLAIENDKEYQRALKNKDEAAQIAHRGRILYSHHKLVTVNCGSQTSVLYYLLTNTLKDLLSNVLFIDSVRLKEKPTSVQSPNQKARLFGHNLLVIRDYSNKNSLYKPGFSGCHENDFVIDSWAKICCPLKDYAKLWDEKMEKWDDRKLKINLGNSTYGDPRNFIGFIKNCEIKSAFSKKNSFINQNIPDLPSWFEESRKIAFG